MTPLFLRLADELQTMPDMIYHDPLDRTGFSPFDKAIHEITEGEKVLMACPYISPEYLKDLIRSADDWSLVTDVGEWLSILDEENRQAVQEFLTEHRSHVRHVPDLHAKVVMGGDRALVGSANLTTKGLTGRTEMSVLLDEKDAIEELAGWFETLWSTYDPPELDQVEAYIESTSSVPNPAQSQTGTTFSVGRSPGTASLSAVADNDSDEEAGDKREQADFVDRRNRIPSPVYEDMPPIPEVTEFKTKTDRTYYNQLISENANQVNLMRRIIREEGELTKGELKQELKKRRDVNISGSFDADLRVLWRSTEEVEPKEPRGDSATLRWVGE
jgi:hypothetical protein